MALVAGDSWLEKTSNHPDCRAAMLSYLRDARLGAALDNLAQPYLAPLAFLALGRGMSAPLVLAIGLIWAAHIGMDRAAGYGLKYAGGFKATNLGVG